VGRFRRFGIVEAVNAALTPPGRQFELVLHPIPEPPPKSGVKAGDLAEEEEVIEPLEKKLKNRFELAWAKLVSKAHPDGLWASAYHIKVAVRDGKTVWLSGGNWQSSNQPDVHPFAASPGKLPAGFQRNYNRDYHAIIVNDRLASIYETYIKRDFELASAQAAKPEPLEAPDLFVPEEEPEPAIALSSPRVDLTPSETKVRAPRGVLRLARCRTISARSSWKRLGTGRP
jgi:hypothetical protein